MYRSSSWCDEFSVALKDGHFPGGRCQWSTDVFMLDSFPDCELSVDRLPDRSLCVEKRGPRGGREEKPASEEQALALSTRIDPEREG